MKNLGLAAIAIAAMLWAVAAIVASELFAAGVQPFELAMARTVVAAIGLSLLYQFGPTSLRSPPAKPLSHRWFEWRLVLLGFALAFVTVSYYVAIDRLAVAVALVIQYTAPALVVALTALQMRQWPAPTTIAAVIAAIVGVVLVSGVLSSQLALNRLGLIAAGLSALFFASYTVLSESVVHTYGAIGVMFRAFIVSSLFWIGFQTAQGMPTAVFAPANLPGILFVGIGGTLIPFSLLCWGIQQVQASQASIAATLEPVIAAALAWLWLGQTLDLAQIIGGILILLAVVSLQRRSMNEEKQG
ncbi:EamA family transporter [Thermocoleostomius sinensis]|jgi:DME family drug/metabolite transporter|uniref:DMT family transporter n=1 Tax=Thermocoleostomius sinensis A174 TaxID=2016057 RepID=A0A9E8ZF00_9CYAN|nr:DMT family transporter [Thermocoleostomius sinensis]WAL59985.1 DMT family transporter [Thermocoleostomius sinensis A174]